MNDKAKKLAIKLSETRSALLALADSTDDSATEKRAELTTEMAETETAYRAALAEPAPTPDPREGGDGESSELRALTRAVSVRDYFAAASHNRGIEGRARELNAAVKAPEAGPSGGAVIPWRVLTEERAYTTTSAHDGPVRQETILQELFGPGIADALGVRFDDAGSATPSIRSCPATRRPCKRNSRTRPTRRWRPGSRWPP